MRYEQDQCVNIGICYPDYVEAEGVPLKDYEVNNLGNLPYAMERAGIG